MVKLVQTEVGSTPLFEVVIGKRLYKKYLEEIGYSKTSTMPNYYFNPKNFVHYGVFLHYDIVYLDYNSNQDLVFVKKIDKKTLEMYKGREKELVECILTKEFSKLQK